MMQEEINHDLLRSIFLKDLHIFKNQDKWIAFGKVSGVILVLEETEAKILIDYLKDENLDKVAQKYSVTEEFCISLFSGILEKIKDKKIFRRSLPPIKSFLVLVAETCNMHCSYCYGTYHNSNSKNVMDVETAKRVIDFANKLHVHEIAFFGGEPLLNFNIIKVIVEYAQKKGLLMNYGITTNGTLITDSIADFFKKNNFKVSVSIDGPKEVHNLTRQYHNGTGTYNDVLRGINKLKERQILSALEITYSMKHPSDLKSIIYSLVPFCNVISCTCVEGKQGVIYEDEIIKGQRLRKYYNDILDILIECNNAGQNLYLGGIIELVDSLLSPTKVIHPYICSGIMERATISIDGSVYPCPETIKSMFCIGNIWNNDLPNYFEESRRAILSNLEKEKLQQYWFSNFVDSCIVRINKNDNGKMSINDVDNISECFEEVIYKITKNNLNSKLVSH